MNEYNSINILIVILSSLLIAYFFVHYGYYHFVNLVQNRVYHKNGTIVPCQAPKLLVGNLADVYNSSNRLAAYHRFHEQLGEIVQIFWMWRQQISVSNLLMAKHILISNQSNYKKSPHNQIIQQLYGSSVLTDHGNKWKQQRFIMQRFFVPQRVVKYHDTFVAYSEKLAAQWLDQIQASGSSIRHDIYPDLTALSIDIIGKSVLGTNLGILQASGDDLVEAVQFILHQSTHPLYHFISWWQRLPLPINYQLKEAFRTVDSFLYGLIQERREAFLQGNTYSDNLLDQLLQSNELGEEEELSFTEKEIRDNLLAILINGYESIATAVALTLDLLARHPEQMTQVQAEVDQMFTQGALTSTSLQQLPYLKAVIIESLRLCPPMAGLQRISIQPDQLADWSIPSQQIIGIPLRPLHLNPRYYGEQPSQFRPQRYLEGHRENVDQEKDKVTCRACPIKKFLGLSAHQNQFPLTFGDGARRCLGETFALNEMAVTLSILLHRFTFTVEPGDQAIMELGKFGLFISMLPKDGVYLKIEDRL